MGREERDGVVRIDAVRPVGAGTIYCHGSGSVAPRSGFAIGQNTG